MDRRNIVIGILVVALAITTTLLCYLLYSGRDQLISAAPLKTITASCDQLGGAGAGRFGTVELVRVSPAADRTSVTLVCVPKLVAAGTAAPAASGTATASATP